MGEKPEFEFEGRASPAEAAALLSRISAGIRARSLALSLVEEGITLHPDVDLHLEIEAKEKKGKAKIAITIAWRHTETFRDGD